MGLYIGNFSTDVNTGNTNVPMYGVKFDGVSSNAGTRLYDATSLNWTPSTASVAGTDDFATLAPFNVRECITKYNSSAQEREVLAYKGDSNWATVLASGEGDRMIEFPKFWYKRPSRYEFIVSPEYIEGFTPSPWHFRNGVMRDYRRITKYVIDSAYTSKSGSMAKNFSSIADINATRDRLRAKGMYLFDFDAYSSIALLMLVKYANMDVQSVVGSGQYQGNSGSSDSILGLDGTLSDKTLAEPIVSFGIENLWGGYTKFIDGFWGYNDKVYYQNIEDVSSTMWSANVFGNNYNIRSLNSSIPMTSGYIKELMYDDEKDYALLCSESDSSSGVSHFFVCNIINNFSLGSGGTQINSSSGILFLSPNYFPNWASTLAFLATEM